MRELKPFEEYLIHEFVHDYREGHMSRRDMMRRIIHITGGVASAATVLVSMGITFPDGSVLAQEATPSPTGPQSPLSVAFNDPRIVGGHIPFPNGNVTISGYEARPAPPPAEEAPAATPGATPAATPVPAGLPLVLVVHENRGLTPHIEDVARRWAVEGYVAFAVDLLSREGRTSGIEDQSSIPGILSNTDPAQFVSDLQAAIEHYRDDPTVDISKIGITGFCFGGGVTWIAATQIPELKAAIPYYGPPPPLDDVPNINAAVLGIYSDDPEDFANQGRDELQAALDAAGVTNEIKVYPGTKHAFNNDTGPNYNEEQSLAAWTDATAWMDQYVKGGS
jgi:carboxymethylenebutenolidase